MAKWDAGELYPTPERLLDRITDGIDWKMVGTVLEPSAGKGDIADYCRKCAEQKAYGRELDIDCIEIDEELRAVLAGKGLRVVHDDFLTFRTFKRYDLIIMNPPFSQGVKHLMHALSLQEEGIGIICILNAESLKNPYTNERRALLQRLGELGAGIEYMEGTFIGSEHGTDVEIAVVKVFLAAKEHESAIIEGLKEKTYQDGPAAWKNDPVPSDFMEAAVRQYNIEAEAGIRLIREYKALRPYIMDDLRDNSFSKPILQLTMGTDDPSVNPYVKAVRRKYWNALFSNPKFTGELTSNMETEYRARLDELKEYDFSTYNIRMLQIRMKQNLVRGIEDCIVKLFDNLSHRYSYHDEINHNIHYYNGWKTNRSWYINKKVILPYMNAFTLWRGEFQPDYAVKKKMADIEKALNYLDGGRTAYESSLDESIQKAVKEGRTSKIRLKYFTVTFYKKGTCHLEFSDEDLLKKLNIFGSLQKGWLPQGYGKRRYQDMDEKEKAVIDSFEGKQDYEKTVANAGYFIYDPSDSLKMIGMDRKKCA